MTLHDMNLLGNPNAALHDSLEFHSLAVQRALSADVVAVVRKFVDNAITKKRYLERTSPLLVNWAYQAASTYSRLYMMTEKEEYLECWQSLDEAFRLLGKRWRISGNNPESYRRSAILTSTAEAYHQVLQMRNSMEMS
jgi:hypothetical protein